MVTTVVVAPETVATASLSETAESVLHAGFGVISRTAAVVRLTVGRSSSGGGSPLVVARLAITTSGLLNVLEFVAQVDYVSLIFSDLGWGRRIVEGDRCANFGLFFLSDSLASLELDADVSGFVHIVEVGTKTKSDMFLVVFGQSIDKAKVVLCLLSLGTVCHFCLKAVNQAFDFGTITL